MVSIRYPTYQPTKQLIIERIVTEELLIATTSFLRSSVEIDLPSGKTLLDELFESSSFLPGIELRCALYQAGAIRLSVDRFTFKIYRHVRILRRSSAPRRGSLFSSHIEIPRRLVGIVLQSSKRASDSSRDRARRQSCSNNRDPAKDSNEFHRTVEPFSYRRN